MESSGSGSGEGSDGIVPSETFHIYLLSFAYGFFIFLLVIHIMWRWQWRRTELGHLKSHYPGDKSFRCKAVRTMLKNDFISIQRLHVSPRARLIKPGHSPDQFGPIGEARVPSHWYRINVFDEAADFVAYNAHLVEDLVSDVSLQDTSTLPLPAFVSHLKENELVDSATNCADRCCQLYEFARYRDGVFMESHWQDFQSSLKELNTQLSTNTKRDDRIHPTTLTTHVSKRDHLAMASPGSEIVIGFGKHDSLQQTTSNDPLIEASDSMLRSRRFEDTKNVREVLGSVTPSRSRSRKGAPQELSPLVKDSDSVDSLDTTAFTNLETNV